MSTAHRLQPRMTLRDVLERFDLDGTLTPADYDVLRSVVAGAAARRTTVDLVDGLLDLFFERHVMNDVRRKELLALKTDEELARAVRHRFRQTVSDEHDAHRPYHALRAHVRAVLESSAAEEPTNGTGGWPAAIQEGGRFSQALVAQAVAALRSDRKLKPSAADATAELMRRYVTPAALADAPEESQDEPEILRRRIDAQRLSLSILEVLNPEERDLLRHLLVDEGSVEAWAKANAISRATAYRMLSRLKTLCQLELDTRSTATQIEALQALSGRLTKP